MHDNNLLASAGPIGGVKPKDSLSKIIRVVRSKVLRVRGKKTKNFFFTFHFYISAID
jgi:hypothetical protein